MKKIIFSLAIILVLGSCSLTATKTQSSTEATIQKSINVANTLAEINSLLNTLNLTPSQSLQIGSILGNYTREYNSLSGQNQNDADYKKALKKIKSKALSNISSNLDSNQYNNFLNSLIYTSNSPNAFLSQGTLNVISSLVN